MCEFCDIESETELIALTEEESQEFVCESESDTEKEQMCGERAEYISKFRYVDEHLCEQHMLKKKEAIESGSEDFANTIGLMDGIVIKPIKSAEVCDALDLKQKACTQPARYAYIVAASAFLCEKHKDS